MVDLKTVEKISMDRKTVRPII